MGLADDLETNLDELYEQTLRVNAEDSFSIAIAATVRRIVDRRGPTLQIERPPDAGQDIQQMTDDVTTAAAGEPDGASAAAGPVVGADLDVA